MVAITGVEDIGKGLIREGTGYVTFPVKYQCVVFRPFKGEILDAVVTMVNKVGLSTCILPSIVVKFCSEALGGDDIGVGGGDCRADLVAKLFVLLVLQMGFFAEAGPVQIFVSNHVSDLLFLVMLCCSNYPNKLQNFSS